MKDSHSTHLVAYEEPVSRGYQCLPVLHYLWGRKWDELALAYVRSVRPTSIRVTTGEIKLDARTGRVTVYVDEDDTILWIEQEATTGWIDQSKRLHFWKGEVA